MTYGGIWPFPDVLDARERISRLKVLEGFVCPLPTPHSTKAGFSHDPTSCTVVSREWHQATALLNVNDIVTRQPSVSDEEGHALVCINSLMHRVSRDGALELLVTARKSKSCAERTCCEYTPGVIEAGCASQSASDPACPLGVSPISKQLLGSPVESSYLEIGRQ